MTFLNATLIFGIAAIAAPIALHLLSRREPKKVIFPSVRLLTKRFEANRNRLQVRRWWLLALRILALAALAIALARPAIHRSLSVTWLTIGMVSAIAVALLVMASVAIAKGQSKGFGYGLAAAALFGLLLAGSWAAYTAASGPAMSLDRDAPVAIAIVLDNSPTSAWKTRSDDRVTRMKDLATWMVTRLPRTSRIAIIDRSAQVATFALDAGSAVARIEQLKPLEVTRPIESRLAAAVRLVRSSDLDNRQVLVVSDLAATSWEQAVSDATLTATLTEGPPVALTLFDLGAFDGANRSLTVPKFTDSSPPRGVPVPLSTTLRVEGTVDDPLSVTAELEIYQNDPALPVVRNGKIELPKTRSVDRTSVKLTAGQSQDLVMTIPALELGIHHGRIRLVGEDAISLDDVRYFSLDVLPASRVLLVSDQAEEARIIEKVIAVTPNSLDGADAEFAVERIGYEDLAVVRLEDFPAVMLLDPPSQAINDKAVFEYTAGGGGLFIALGPSAGEDPLPSTLVPSLVLRWRSPQPGTFLQIQNRAHPICQPVSVDTPWSDFRIAQYWQVQPNSNDRVLIGFAGTEHPALVERVVSDAEAKTTGRVLVLTTPIPALVKPARVWNDLYGIDPWPAWLLTRQTVEYLTGRASPRRMTQTGSRPLVSLGESIQTDQLVPERLQLFRPAAGTPTPIDIPPGATMVPITEISRSGVYWIRGLQTGAGLSANLNDDALSLERISPAQLDLVFGADQYGLATDRDEIEFAESKAAQRVSLQAPAMLLALAVFLLEQILGNRFYRRARQAAASGVSANRAAAT